MKMKPILTILMCVLVAGLVSAQSPSIIQHTRNTMNTVTTQNTAASNEALGVHQNTAAVPASAAPVSPNSSRKPAAVPMKSSAPSSRPERAKHKGPRNRIWAVGVVGVSPATPVAGARENNLPASSDVRGNSASEGGEYESSEQSVVPDAKYNANGRRDPFISPVVSHAGGSGCSTGKKCLEIGALNLRGVVHSESGFIAVVSNGLNKAYFLRENDPVFNGYVRKITGDSIVFQETLQDRLGKTITREVVKKITAPAV
jgi:hypothetical protein